MGKKMNIFGIGDKLILVTLPYVALVFFLHYAFAPFFDIPGAPNRILLVTGLVLMGIGLTFNFVAAFMMARSFKKRKLLTKGPYRVFKNPMYGSFILLTIPGLSLALGSWLILTVSLYMYLFFRLLIKDEEKYLEREFGKVYMDYKKSVWVKGL